MTINFDEYKEGEPITIIMDGVSKTYNNPTIRFRLEGGLIYPPIKEINIDIESSNVIILMN